MFTAMGSFGVLAGLLLLVNLFVMLAAERKTELGMARAVGMRRSELVGAFATEGWIYALVATALGVAARNRARRRARVALRPDLRHRAQPLRPVLHAEAAEPGAVVRDRLRRRARDHRRHEPPGEPAQHHSCDPRPRGAAAAPAARSLAARRRRLSPLPASRSPLQGWSSRRRLRAPARTESRRPRTRAARRAPPPGIDQSTPSLRCSSSSGAHRSSRSSPSRPRAPASCSTSSRESC